VDTFSSHFDVLGPRFAPLMPEQEAAGPWSADHPEISFRRYQPGDIPACARLAEDAWPPGSVIGSKHQEVSGMESYMEYSVDVSNWTDVAYTSDGIVGFLFGRIENLAGTEVPKRSLLGELKSLLGTFLEYGPMTPTLLRFLWNLYLTEVKVRLRMPESDASIEMFIVDSKHRGKGVGGELLDRFLKASRDAGASLVTLYTDDRMSNWGFYESHGFKRVGTFHDNVTTHYSGTKAQGIIFAMDLENRKVMKGNGFS